MLNTETTGARDFRRDLTRHLVAAEHGGKTTIVTRNGKPAAALVPMKVVQRATGSSDWCGAPIACPETGAEVACDRRAGHPGPCSSVRL